MSKPDLYISAPSTEDRREALEKIVRLSARYGHDLAARGFEAPDLRIEWTDEGRILVFNDARRRRWWQRFR